MTVLIILAIALFGTLIFVPTQSQAEGMRHPLRRCAWWRSNDGSAAIEFGLVFPAFLGMLLGFILVVITFLTGTDLQRAADTAGYKIKTGEITAALADFRSTFCDAVVMVACDDKLAFEITSPQDINADDQFVTFTVTYSPAYSVLVRTQTASATTMTVPDCMRFIQCIGVISNNQ